VNDFWQKHSLKFLEMAYRTDRCETVENADGCAEKTGDCGDRIEIFLSLKQGRIDSVSYRLEGCIHTNACVNAVAELVEGKPVEAAWRIDPDAVADYLETLPEDHYHCAELAVGAFYLALADSQRPRSAVERIYGKRRLKLKR
jgi:nitrogen fixation NifU-like protein